MIILVNHSKLGSYLKMQKIMQRRFSLYSWHSPAYMSNNPPPPYHLVWPITLWSISRLHNQPTYMPITNGLSDSIQCAPNYNMRSLNTKLSESYTRDPSQKLSPSTNILDVYCIRRNTSNIYISNFHYNNSLTRLARFASGRAWCDDVWCLDRSLALIAFELILSTNARGVSVSG